MSKCTKSCTKTPNLITLVTNVMYYFEGEEGKKLNEIILQHTYFNLEISTRTIADLFA